MILIECFGVLKVGVDGLKIFFVLLFGLLGIKVICVVLLKGIQVYVVGGVGLDNFKDWIVVSVDGFGIGIVFYMLGLLIIEIIICVNQIVVVYDVVWG